MSNPEAIETLNPGWTASNQVYISQRYRVTLACPWRNLEPCTVIEAIAIDETHNPNSAPLSRLQHHDR